MLQKEAGGKKHPLWELRSKEEAAEAWQQTFGEAHTAAKPPTGDGQTDDKSAVL